MSTNAIKFIKEDQKDLAAVISLSIGNPTDDKLKKVIASYMLNNNFLVGSFVEVKLVGVIGIEYSPPKIIIKHLAILPAYAQQGRATDLITYVLQHFKPTLIYAETDNDAIGFYTKLKFACLVLPTVQGKNRYGCTLQL